MAAPTIAPALGPTRPAPSTPPCPWGCPRSRTPTAPIYAQTMASAMIAALPLTILFMLVQRQIIKAVATTGLGGQ